jgi:gas vesicle protein
MTNSERKLESQSNSGFIFGLTLGAAVGALSAILINKNSEAEVVQNFESKVKDFFRDLVSEIKTKKEEADKKSKFIDIEEVKEEPEKPHIVIHRKSTPKMFVKPKK